MLLIFYLFLSSIEMKVAKHVPDVEPCVNGKRGVLKRHIDRRHSKSSQMSSSDEDEAQVQDVAKRKNNTVLNLTPHDLPSTSGVQCPASKNTISSSAHCSTSRNQNDNDASPSDNSASKTESSSNYRQNPMTRKNRQRQLEGLDRMEQRLKDLRAGNNFW